MLPPFVLPDAKRGSSFEWHHTSCYPFSQLIWRAETERERRLLMFLPGLNITEVGHLNACPVGLACFHPVVASKRQMSDRKNGSGLKLFIGGGECVGLQVPIAGLFQHIGHRHERIGIFSCVLHLGAQGTNLFFDLLMIFAGWPFFLAALINPSDSSGRMLWKTCLRLAWARRMRPAYSISHRSWRLP